MTEGFGQIEHQGFEETVVESASATTSADNVNSGVTAYVIFGVVVALLLFASGAVGGFIEAAIFGYGDYNPYYYEEDDVLGDDWINDFTDDELEDMYNDLDEYINDMSRETDQS